MTSLAELRAKFPQYESVSDGDFLIGLNRKFYPQMHPRAFLDSIEGTENAHATIKNDNLKAWYRENVQKPLEGEASADTARRVGGTSEGPVGEDPSPLESAIHGAAQGVTFGFADEAIAPLLAATTDMDREQAIRFMRDRIDLGREANPVSAYGSEIAGALAAPAAVLKGGSGLLGNMARSGAVAGGEGFLYGVGAGEGGLKQRARSGAETGILAALLGGAAPVVGRAARNIYGNIAENAAVRKAIKAAPSMDDLRAGAERLYAQADQVTGMPRGDFANAAQGMLDDAVRKGMDADLTPGAAKVADRITDAATGVDPNIGFRELDILRRKAAVPAGNLANRTESALGSGMIEGIDDFIDTADPNLGGVVKEARDMWARLRRSDTIQAAMKRAEEAASGYENGLAIEFRRILKSDKLSRGFSDAEKKAMQAVVRGTPFGNFFRQVGKMGIGLNRQSNGLGAMVGGLAGGATLGPIGGLLFPAIGTVAKAGTNAAKRSAAKRAAALIQAGGTPPVQGLGAPAQGVLEMIARRASVPVANQLYP